MLLEYNYKSGISVGIPVQGHCSGFHNVLRAYENIVHSVRLSGPTNFAPLIQKAVEIVKNTRAVSMLKLENLYFSGMTVSKIDSQPQGCELGALPLSCQGGLSISAILLNILKHYPGVPFIKDARRDFHTYV